MRLLLLLLRLTEQTTWGSGGAAEQRARLLFRASSAQVTKAESHVQCEAEIVRVCTWRRARSDEAWKFAAEDSMGFWLLFLDAFADATAGDWCYDSRNKGNGAQSPFQWAGERAKRCAQMSGQCSQGNGRLFGGAALSRHKRQPIAMPVGLVTFAKTFDFRDESTT